MKRFRVILASALLLALVFAVAAQAADDIKLDVVDGNFVSGEYNIPLAKNVEKPILIGMANGDVILRITTTFGDMELNMGKGRVVLTERASGYVQVQKASSSANANPTPVNTGTCPACGLSMAQGNHTKLECGHYYCLVGPGHPRICPSCQKYTCNKVDHTPCPGCGVGACRHVSCDWSRNPFPTPYSRKAEDGSTIYYYLDPNGEYYIGSAVGTPYPWSPAQTYALQFATPKPTPLITPEPTDDPWR